jgi:hypothetical protein
MRGQATRRNSLIWFTAVNGQPLFSTFCIRLSRPQLARRINTIGGGLGKMRAADGMGAIEIGDSAG